ncbi:MAG: hypothetical protein Q9222_002968 [Ikaeria aurantiellina]
MMGIPSVESSVIPRSLSPDAVAFHDKHPVGQLPFLQRPHENIYGGLSPYSGLLAYFSVLSFTTTITEDERAGELGYTDLPKIVLREKSLLSGMITLSNQVLDTMIFFQRHLARRAFSRAGASGPQQRSYQIAHLYTEKEEPLGELAARLMLKSYWDKNDIPVIFPIAPDIWELIIEASYLKGLRRTARLGEFTLFPKPGGVPKGLMGRAAQVTSVVLQTDSWVSAIYLDLIQRTPWHRMMKDTVESLTIHHSTHAMVGDHIYEL